MYRKEKNEKDILYILEHLRDEDKHEALIQKGENYIEECLKDIMNNDYVLLGCKKSDDTPVCMGGCAKTTEEGIGVVWFLSTPEIVNYQTCLLRNIKKEISFFDEKYWMLFNMLYSENNLAKRWLKKFGFNFNNPHPVGLNIPKDFEFFYRLRKTRGLNNAASAAISKTGCSAANTNTL